jgi:pimeloyl-ACP methyl ester carboxylesterase
MNRPWTDLASPTGFSRQDESKISTRADRLSRVFGHLPYSLMLKVIGPAMKSGLPPARRDVLTNELKKNQPRFLREQTHQYLAYLDRHGSLAKRFCDSTTQAWVGYGENDDIRLAAEERALLEAAPGIRLVEIADAGHFTLNQKPDEIADLVLQAVASARTR